MKYPQLVSMPSAVSDWLEEQLEARGIDAVVYTRYVLSLLYRDPVDIICPDQDLHVTNPNKEVRRTGGGGRKRFCRSNDYWGHADADQLKRSAAVECLKSASDQKCGIESLVDELCTKLKEIQNDTVNNTDTFSDSQQAINKASTKISEKDSAKRYYAAFPALSRNTATSPKLIQLIPKWFGSPKRRLTKKQNRATSFEDKLHSTCKNGTDDMKARSVGKQRFNYFTRNTTTNNSNINNNNNNRKDNIISSGYSNRNMMNFYNSSKQHGKEGSGMIASQKKVEIGDSLKDFHAHEESMVFDDLPVDIRDLLDSPTPQEVEEEEAMHVDLMNLANMRDAAGGSNKFIQCGTNIISSIWSTNKEAAAPLNEYDNKFTMDDPYLDYKFSNISIDRNLWSSPIEANDCSGDSLFDEHKSIIIEDDPWNYKVEKWSEGYDQEHHITRSLMKLNHIRDGSCFAEVKPRIKPFPDAYSTLASVVKKQQQQQSAAAVAADTAPKEDLLHSTSSHFKPINEKLEAKVPHVYADGTTFAIPSSLDKIHYQRSDSGTMFLEEQGFSKRYLEYKKGDNDFILKFHINQNDKACQTEELDDDYELLYLHENDEEFYFPGDRAQLDHGEDAKWQQRCTCPPCPGQLFTRFPMTDNTFAMSTEHSYGTDEKAEQRPDSMMAELFGKEAKCEKCDGTPSWLRASPKPIGWRKDGHGGSDSSNIWNGEICMACLRCNNASRADGFKLTPLAERKQLRDDIKEDGEQLLSDLSSLQKTYMEQEDLPMGEETCDLNTLINSASTDATDVREATEWKDVRINKHGGMPIHSASFSFATRLQQDCLLKMATIPTLRSVTL